MTTIVSIPRIPEDELEEYLENAPKQDADGKHTIGLYGVPDKTNRVWNTLDWHHAIDMAVELYPHAMRTIMERRHHHHE